ncbi:MAG: hypothetical protein J6T01_01990, partial [Kiritimatiellae bacterium]|nr:hypothetical protein [Kiritimatiellia bacterium]
MKRSTSEGKKMKVITAFAAVAAAACSAAAAPLKVAYPAPGTADIMTPPCRVRIVMGGFLDDLFRHDTNDFTRIGDRLKTAVISQINSGAWEFETPDKRVNFEMWHPLDLFIDYNYVSPEGADKPGLPAGVVKVDFWWRGGSETKEFALMDLTPACEWVLGRILEKCAPPEANAKKLRKFFDDRRLFLQPYYLSPGIVGHYCDNGVDTRMPCALDGYKLSRNNPIMATRAVDAAYLDVIDGREKKKYTTAKVKAIGMAMLESVVGKLDPLDEEILKPFIYHYRDDVRKMLARVTKDSDSDSLENLEDAVLSDSADDVGGDLSLTKKNSAKDVAAIRAAAKRFLDWCDHGYEKAPPVPGEADEVAKYTTGGGEHPLLVRHRLLSAEKKKDLAFIKSHIGDFHRQSRALALKLYARLDPEGAYPHLLKAMEDVHTWARLYASIDLARLAKAADAAKIRGFLAKERNRAVKLYLEDAAAKAEGRPAPPP